MKQNHYWFTNELFIHLPSDKQKKYMTTADRRENKIQTEGFRKGKEKNLENNKDHLLYSARRPNDNKPLLTRRVILQMDR